MEHIEFFEIKCIPLVELLKTIVQAAVRYFLQFSTSCCLTNGHQPNMAIRRRPSKIMQAFIAMAFVASAVASPAIKATCNDGSHG
eukprot:3238098-Amphidinium_carterae.1